MVIRTKADLTNWDPYYGITFKSIKCAYMESLFTDDWTLDPSVVDLTINYRPQEYVKGALAESWEFTDPNTFVYHIRKGVHWQDIYPANGREFTADDVVFHFGRIFGLGAGFTKPSPVQGSSFPYQSVISVTATDKYTVVFKWSVSNPEYILESLHPLISVFNFENPEAVKLWGDVNDWHHAIGTGPFILKDFVSGSSATLVKNPNYWGYDERYPQNKLPYIDKLHVLIIPDDATAIAALRTGKIEALAELASVQARSIQKTNPEILQVSGSLTAGLSIDPRNDVKPFNDIRVRKAMQMALDLRTIAESYFLGSADPYPSSITSPAMAGAGWGFPYSEWPQDLKDEYAYDPSAAKKLLANAGYPTGFKTNIVADATSDKDLLQIVKSYFADVGIDMEIKIVDSATFSSFVLTNHKQDALAHRPTGRLAMTWQPIVQLNFWRTTITFNYMMLSDPALDAFYNNAMASTTIAGVKKAVRDANEYITRQHCTISLVVPKQYNLYQPWLKGYAGQCSAVYDGVLMNFYPARFWIDQNMKKSMGR